MKRALLIAALIPVAIVAVAGGNPEFVNLPGNYLSEFSNYDVRNRGNGKQLAVLYANKTAVESAANGVMANGSVIVMEIYKKKLDENGNAVMNSNGLFEKGKFAAIAVMEKRDNWESGFASEQRAGNWGFAIYNTDGSVKDNNLDCASCHIPLENQGYMFSHASLVEYSGGQ